MSPVKRLGGFLEVLRLDEKVGSARAGYIPPTLSERIIDSMPVSSRTPLAISASVLRGKSSRKRGSGDFIAAFCRSV